MSPRLYKKASTLSAVQSGVQRPGLAVNDVHLLLELLQVVLHARELRAGRVRAHHQPLLNLLAQRCALEGFCRNARIKL